MSQLDLPKLDDKFCSEPGVINNFLTHQEHYFYGSHCKFEITAGGTTELYNIYGRDETFCLMSKYEQTELDLTSGEETIHRINTCADKYNRPGHVTLLEFCKVAQPEEKVNDDDKDYRVNTM